MSTTIKLKSLKDNLAAMKSALVAYSGGVDSTFLLKVAQEVLGDNVVAVTAASETYPSNEIEYAVKMAETLGAKLITIHTDEFSNKKFTENPRERCYWCKKELFMRLTALAKEYNLNFVLDGSNFDDINDFRPGMKAAAELRVRSPLKEAGLTKDEIRYLSEKLGLPTWNKPSFACLASRFPYGTEITKKNLLKVDSAERFLKNLGLTQVRVRHHNDTARIEVIREEMKIFLDDKIRTRIISHLKSLGYTYIALDLEGYRTGSMNEAPAETD
jgi:uncharacterized protein